MTRAEEKEILVGDNPFHGISHLSQDSAKDRDGRVTHPEHAADIVAISLQNGATGWMFTVSESTLSILTILSHRLDRSQLRLYAMVPYAYEYVRSAVVLGGIPGLAKKLAKQLILSANVKAISYGFKGIVGFAPEALEKAYLNYEIGRIRLADKKANLVCLLLNEVVTDMALALNLDWLFRTYIDSMADLGVKPGFNTRNLPYLVNKFREWGISLREVAIAAPFNSVGFQMYPSKDACEETLKEIPEADVIAISLLAAGYLKPEQAIAYVANLPNLRGVAVGVSKENQARETFKLLEERFKNKIPPAKN